MLYFQGKMIFYIHIQKWGVILAPTFFRVGESHATAKPLCVRDSSRRLLSSFPLLFLLNFNVYVTLDLDNMNP